MRIRGLLNYADDWKAVIHMVPAATGRDASWYDVANAAVPLPSPSLLCAAEVLLSAVLSVAHDLAVDLARLTTPRP